MRESGYGMPPYGVGHASGAPPRAPGGPRPCGRRSLGTAPRSGHAPRPLRGGGQKRGREVRALVRLGGELTPEHYLVCEDALARAVTATDPQRFHADLLASCYDLRSLVGARVEGLCRETLLARRALVAHDPEWCLPSLMLDEVGRPAETGPLLREAPSMYASLADDEGTGDEEHTPAEREAREVREASRGWVGRRRRAAWTGASRGSGCARRAPRRMMAPRAGGPAGTRGAGGLLAHPGGMGASRAAGPGPSSSAILRCVRATWGRTS